MIFADTSFWVALNLVRDQHHAESVRLLRARGPEGLIVSNHVLGESWTFLRRRAGHGVAVDFLDRVERSGRVFVTRVPDELEQQALRWLRRHDEREYSFVDATSFALMRSIKVREAFAFDGDFEAAGFVELRNASMAGTGSR